MNKDEQIHELTAIHLEYSSFFPICELSISKPTLTTNSNDIYGRMLSRSKNFLRIETSENIKIKVSVEAAGWFVMNETGKHYETFEALMMELSPSFQAHHASQLATKLQKLLDS